MSTWYEVTSGTDIREVEVVRESDKSLWVVEASWKGVQTVRRTLKWTRWHRYFRTKEEAVTSIRSHLTRKVDRLRGAIVRAEENLEAFNFKHKEG